MTKLQSMLQYETQQTVGKFKTSELVVMSLDMLRVPI